MLKTVQDILNNRHALRCQFYVNLKTTVVTTRLGMLWWILDPLLFMGIYYFVIKIVFDRGGPNYHLFALCGIVTWQSFSRSINLSTTALVRNMQLIKQASLPMFLYVIISPFVQAVFYCFGLAIIVVWNYPAVGAQTLAVLVLVFLMILMACAIGLFLSVFHVFFRDTGKFVTYILRFGFFMSPVLYSPERIFSNPAVPYWAKALWNLNPMVHFITAVRDLLFDGRMFQWGPILIVFAVTLCFLQLGLLFFRRVSPYVPKML